jgi:hypothetical protein
MMLRRGTKTLTPIVAVLATTFLMGQGLDTGSPSMSPPADEASPAVDTLPTAVNPDIPSATAPAPENKAVVVPLNKPQAAAPAAPAAKKEKAAKAAKTEVLPWANTPIVPSVPGATDPANAAAAATAAQCAGLFEAQCRDVATCAWVADINREDGASVAAHCAGRGAAPPKKAASKPKPKPKPEATAAAATSPPSAEAPRKSMPITVSPPAPAAEAPAQAPASDGSIVVKMPTPE